MNNIFIMHTQFNLLLAIALKNQCFSNDKNVLLIHAEFELSNEMIAKLENEFSKVIVLQNNYTDFHKLKQFKHIKKILKKLNFEELGIVDRVVLSQDNYIDTLLITKIHKSNDFEILAVEEDVYFGLDPETFNRRIKKEQKSLTRKIYNFLLRLLFGKNVFYQKCICYGCNSNIQKLYVFFPDSLRKELVHKETISINKTMFLNAIDVLLPAVDYGNSLEPKQKTIFLFLDLVERYKNKDDVKEMIEKTIKYSKSLNINVFVKYHPRETDKFIKIEENTIFEIRNNIPAERVFSSLSDNRSAIFIGNKSTVVQMARYFGFKTISLITILDEDNNSCVLFFNKIGVIVPKTIDELFSFLK